MSDNSADPIDLEMSETTDDAPPPKVRTPQARRALAEAEARRLAHEAKTQAPAKEFQGPKGPEPTRYGDWETKGIISDF